jgi:hypothetical protein
MIPIGNFMKRKCRKEEDLPVGKTRNFSGGGPWLQYFRPFNIFDCV